MLTEKWHYNGDVNLEYGGLFIDLSTWNDGYCSAVRVTDLDGDCGFTGACMIEHVVIFGTDDAERINKAIGSFGMDIGEFAKRIEPAKRKECLRHFIADALCSYGFVDPDDSWDNYQSYHTEIVQMESDGPMKFDGWKADKRLHNTTIDEYVQSQHLRP